MIRVVHEWMDGHSLFHILLGAGRLMIHGSVQSATSAAQIFPESATSAAQIFPENTTCVGRDHSPFLMCKRSFETKRDIEIS
jgi:hypothetical protein